LLPKVLPFLGYFFNKLTKSSLIGEKLPNLVTLPVTVTVAVLALAPWAI
jgi:hypothetical protein